MSKLDKINKLEQQLALLKAEILAEQELSKISAQWEPVGGDWFVTGDNQVYNSLSEEAFRKTGSERPTKELAEKAAKEIRVYKRLLAYRDQFDPDFVENWDGDTENYFVDYSTVNGCYYSDYYTSCKTLGVVYMSEEVANELCRKLNSGEVVL